MFQGPQPGLLVALQCSPHTIEMLLHIGFRFFGCSVPGKNEFHEFKAIACGFFLKIIVLVYLLASSLFLKDPFLYNIDSFLTLFSPSSQLIALPDRYDTVFWKAFTKPVKLHHLPIGEGPSRAGIYWIFRAGRTEQRQFNVRPGMKSSP